jgi:predicted ArsR family transcriptional regulator
VKAGNTTPTETMRHRALADPRRARIVEELRGRAGGADVATLAGVLGLHANTVRWHLGILADAGLVRSRPDARGAPGRPRVVWQLAAEHHEPRQNYRLLATILTGAVAATPDAGAGAEAAGHAWGRFLVERPPPHVVTSDDADVEAGVALLDHEGFEPERNDTTIRMHRCPFRDLAETHGHVVCPLHRGLIAGALAERGSSLEVAALEPFVEPGLCVARLERR